MLRVQPPVIEKHWVLLQGSKRMVSALPLDVSPEKYKFQLFTRVRIKNCVREKYFCVSTWKPNWIRLHTGLTPERYEIIRGREPVYTCFGVKLSAV